MANREDAGKSFDAFLKRNKKRIKEELEEFLKDE